MLRVGSVQNYNNSISFNARFVHNGHLDNVIANASDYDLMKFGKILESMKKRNPKVSYEIVSRPVQNWNWETEGVTLELEKIVDKPEPGIISSTSFKDLCVRKSYEKCYDGILNKINKMLEPFYPEEEVTKVKRETSLKKIDKLLKA